MSLPAQSSAVDDSMEHLPREFAAIMRPELPSLVHEIGVDVIRAFPEYAQLLNGPNAGSIRLGVERSLTAFVDRIADPTSSTAARDEILRTFGRVEAYEGRDIETLQGAYRLGARVALRRAKSVGRRYDLSPTLLLTFADTLFTYVDELAALSREGYTEALARVGSAADVHRRRLLHLLLAGTPLTHSTIGELCEQGGWPLPGNVTLVALRDPVPDHVAAGLAPDVLADLGAPQPHLLLPGPFTAERRASLEVVAAAAPLVVGLTVPTAQAADSLRWARQLQQLIDDGAVPDAPYTDCAGHLLTLWLLSDPALVSELTTRELAPLDKATGTRRTRLVETLHAWLTTRGTAEQIGDTLGVHAQTVRYRMRNLMSHFGVQLEDPTHRFAIEAGLRALQLLGRGKE
ncbi:helix-turn-helix domain-containing protein [Streptomyces sp. B-S-A8]|uniref:Helix-turn-helix domain-containing protein n=1 Tax=Streptomyces solicavernae TaxID=3043614 RepID=A0ABT6RP92_9ACTN|nr:helix-turn-helix domain-containing protein [Streptomyces sp. B-S-A8]MDI3386251.1 helix-turn-helix domain-containing protein [Streptomyces sp. B-S-A8]